MIYDLDTRPRGVTLIRIPRAGGRTKPDFQLSDYIPLLTQGRGDARQWRGDAVLGSQANRTSVVAESPLADGSAAANHVRRQPIPFSFDALITDTPLVPLSPLTGNGGLGGLPGVRRADAILASLNDVWASRSFVALVSPTLVLETAVVTNVVENRTPDDGSAYYVSITVQEIRTFTVRQFASIDDDAAQLGGARTTASGGVVWSGG